jgi:hypothetical protein
LKEWIVNSITSPHAQRSAHVCILFLFRFFVCLFCFLSFFPLFFYALKLFFFE